MKTFTAVVEKDQETGLYVGYFPGLCGAHTQGATLDEVRDNLIDVIGMLLEDNTLRADGVLVGTQQINIDQVGNIVWIG